MAWRQSAPSQYLIIDMNGIRELTKLTWRRKYHNTIKESSGALLCGGYYAAGILRRTAVNLRRHVIMSVKWNHVKNIDVEEENESVMGTRDGLSTRGTHDRYTILCTANGRQTLKIILQSCKFSHNKNWSKPGCQGIYIDSRYIETTWLWQHDSNKHTVDMSKMYEPK